VETESASSAAAHRARRSKSGAVSFDLMDIGELQGHQVSDLARDDIYGAFYSAFVKYPQDKGPTPRKHWIKPLQSVHLTKVVMLELEAHGFQIVKKAN
jgi:hypothetical protein